MEYASCQPQAAEAGPSSSIISTCTMSAVRSYLLRLQRSATVVAASRLTRPLVTAGTTSRGVSSCRERHPAVLSRSRAVNIAAVPVGGGRCFHNTSAAQRRGDRAEASTQPEASDTRPSEAGRQVRNPAVQEKWGWSSATHRWYYPLKAMGVFSKKNTNALSAARMLQTCLNNAERQEWYSDGKISNEFLPKLLWLSTNVWLLSRRLLREGDRGKKVQELLFDELWRETKRQMRSIQVSEMMLKKYLSEAQQHTFVTLVQYDHAYTLESREERMEILMSALWRGVFMNNESIKEPHVRVIAEYMDKELAEVYQIDAEDFFAVCMEFAPPPPELKASNAVKQVSKGGDRRNRKGKTVPTKAPLGVPQEGASEGQVVGEVGRERFEHEDIGEDFKGRWRACLAESGKAYYWHTKTREVTWDKPAESEPFIPSIMPKVDQTATA